MSTVPVKRQPQENLSITRSEPWVRDGNVVLQAANTQFRIHWSVLALHSSVFRDMEGLSQPHGEPTVEGCPVVELSDNLADVEYLLKALYVPEFHCQKRLPLAAVGALIRLGRKYDFGYLFKSAVARLTSINPTTLEEYDAMPASADIELSTIEWYWGWELDIIALASENNILSVLPCAYLRVVERYSLVELFDGLERKDGTHAALPSVGFRRCLEGQRTLSVQQFRHGYTMGWTRESYFYCTDSVRCRKSRDKIMGEHMESLDILALKRPTHWNSYKLCSCCRQHVAEFMAAGRRKIWRELPEIFGLPPWNELNNDI
ncbi:hypothetical protein K438DRAFT_1559130 [Mycena galopus ATCC 62051]|nr:hypothetical protein K438DRAFT_1559130 [Mycena galopus ATCC 62051]